MVDTLLESQLFDTCEGRLQGPRTCAGLFEYPMAHGVPGRSRRNIAADAGQALRVIQNREIQRVVARSTAHQRAVDRRHQQDLRAEVLAGRFREDLFYG